MKKTLIELFLAYLAEHYPDQILKLRKDKDFEGFVEASFEALEVDPEELVRQGIPVYQVQEICLKQLTDAFGPSRYDYLLTLLRDEFGAVLDDWKAEDLLPSKAVALLGDCEPAFELFGFSHDQDENEGLRDALITAIYRSLRAPAFSRDVDHLLEGLLNPRT